MTGASKDEMKRILLLVSVLCLFSTLASCSQVTGKKPQHVEDVYLPDGEGVKVESWVGDLEIPWSLVFLPDGRALAVGEAAPLALRTEKHYCAVCHQAGTVRFMTFPLQTEQAVEIEDHSVGHGANSVTYRVGLVGFGLIFGALSDRIQGLEGAATEWYATFGGDADLTWDKTANEMALNGRVRAMGSTNPTTASRFGDTASNTYFELYADLGKPVLGAERTWPAEDAAGSGARGFDRSLGVGRHRRLALAHGDSRQGRFCGGAA